MSIINSQPLIGASGNQGGYTIAKSLRFRSSASAYLNRTPGTSGNLQTWTWSGWVKLGTLSADRTLFGSLNSGSTQLANIHIAAANSFEIDILDSNSTRTIRATTAVFRDPSAWYHVVFALDTTQATAANRMKLYVNGTQISLDVAAVGTYPAQNANSIVNSTSGIHNVGRRPVANDRYFDGYMADVYLIDGQALTPSSFGETDSITGVWKPKAYSGSYGTNGYYLKFTDVATTSGSNAGLGKDFSGNGNYWTTNNVSVTTDSTYDSIKDVPTLTDANTANYCVLNPLNTRGYALSYANLIGTLSTNNDASNWQTRGSIAITSGKWYWEFSTSTISGIGTPIVGVCDPSLENTANIAASSSAWLYYGYNGNKYNGSGASYGSTWGSNANIAVALDMDNGTITFYVNGTSQGTAYTNLSGKTVVPVIFNDGGGDTYSISINFGQQPFTYTPPTGYKALNTYNLPDSTIVAGNKYMDATTYTSNGTTQTVTNAGGFKPDLLWIKNRSITQNNYLSDSNRGVSKILNSNSTAAESTSANFVTSLNSNGFSFGVDNTANGDSMVGWQWQAGQSSGSSNTNGSITSTVSVSTTAGFSVVTYTGNNTAGATIGHGLGVAPSFIIIKNRDVGTTDWLCYHKDLGATKYLLLQSTNASGTSILAFNNTAPTSSVFSVGGWDVPNGSGNKQVAYCWTEIAGFSKMGSYTGNGSTDGPFVYTGFRPKFVIWKCTTAAYDWDVYDTSRDTYNAATNRLKPNSSDAEAVLSPGPFDMLSNGFKLRYGYNSSNASGQTFIYMAFAENPFKNSLAR